MFLKAENFEMFVILKFVQIKICLSSLSSLYSLFSPLKEGLNKIIQRNLLLATVFDFLPLSLQLNLADFYASADYTFYMLEQRFTS